MSNIFSFADKLQALYYLITRFVFIVESIIAKLAPTT